MVLYNFDVVYFKLEGKTTWSGLYISNGDVVGYGLILE